MHYVRPYIMLLGTSAVIGLMPPTPAVTQVFNTRIVNSPILVIGTSFDNFEQNPVTIVLPMSSKVLYNYVSVSNTYVLTVYYINLFPFCST